MQGVGCPLLSLINMSVQQREINRNQKAPPMPTQNKKQKINKTKKKESQIEKKKSAKFPKRHF